MIILFYEFLGVYIFLKFATIVFNIIFMLNLGYTNASNRWIDTCKKSDCVYWFMFVVVILFSIVFYINIINAYIDNEKINSNNEPEMRGSNDGD